LREEMLEKVEKAVRALVEEYLEEAEKKVREAQQLREKAREVQEEWEWVIRALREEEFDRKRVRKLLCYESLAYCCGLQKPCIFRDTAMALLGISEEEYERLKKELDEKLHGV